MIIRGRRVCRHAINPLPPAGRRLLAASAVVVLTTGVIAGTGLLGWRLFSGSVIVRAVGAGSASSVSGAGVATAGGSTGDRARVPSLSTGTSPPAVAATATADTTTKGAVDATNLTTDDRKAGVLRALVPQHGTGKLTVVPGTSPAPGAGAVKRVRVEVEGGLPVDGAAFATFVMGVLNDPRGWGHGGRMTFARTSGAHDIRVVLASPDTSERMCGSLQTMGTLSCGVGHVTVLTLYRWVKANLDYGTDRTGYRRYLVNHEVGHTLGHGHEMCPGPGKIAPVMMQQTKGLKGCRPNSWPFP